MLDGITPISALYHVSTDIALCTTTLYTTPMLSVLFAHLFAAAAVVLGQLFEVPGTEECQETARWV